MKHWSAKPRHALLALAVVAGVLSFAACKRTPTPAETAPSAAVKPAPANEK